MVHNTNHKQIYLFYVTNETTAHYFQTRHFSRLVTSQSTKYEHKYYYSKRCLSHFDTEGKLLENIDYCKNIEAVRTMMPKTHTQKKNIKFKELNSLLDNDVIIIVDFECFV